MGSEVVYLVSGMSHCERLAVSLFSLRQHWDGPVRILDMGGADGLADRIANFGDAAHERIRIRPPGKGKNAIYAAKASIGVFLKAKRNLFLDCDTTVHGGISRLFELVDEHQLVVTRFSNWITTGNLLTSRLSKWARVKSDVMDVPGTVARLIDEPHVAINTGVFAVRNNCAFLADWPVLVSQNPGFICDEIAAQLLITKHRHVIVGDRWNHSAKFGEDKDPAIRHYHGRSHVDHPAWVACRTEAVGCGFAGLEEWS